MAVKAFRRKRLLIGAAICSEIGQMLAGYSIGGCITSTLVGFVGAVIGTWTANSCGLPEIFAIKIAGQAFPIDWLVTGSAFFVASSLSYTWTRDDLIFIIIK